MTTTSDPALLDTNVLVYALFPAVPEHAASRALNCSIAKSSPAVLMPGSLRGYG